MATKCKLTVQAGPHDRSTCPVSVDLPWVYSDTPAVELRDAKSKKSIPCQVAKSRAGVTLTWLADGLKAGTEQSLVAKAVAKPEAESKCLLVEDRAQQKIDVQIGGKLFTSYNYGHQWVRPFLYPVIGPYGLQVTRNYPMRDDVPGEYKDHHHHKSIWVAYGECNGTDNWSEGEGHGWQRHVSFSKKVSGPVYAQIVAKNNWCTSKERKQFEETRDMRFYALPGGTRLFDVNVTFRMTESNVVFTDTKEGGLVSVRVASSMDVRETGTIENGYGGVNEAETWGKNAPWCDYSGLVDGKQVGIAILDHETNPRYPTGWHVRNYGLMTANCFAWKYYRPEAKVKGDMTFKKGSKTTWRYRLYIHKGDAAKSKVKNRFLDYVAPPAVSVE